MTPIVHLNGTSARELIDLRCAVYSKLREAIEELRRMAPHGRDYYVSSDPDALKKAQDVHYRRLKCLTDLQDELSKEAEEISRQSGVL